MKLSETFQPLSQSSFKQAQKIKPSNDWRGHSPGCFKFWFTSVVKKVGTNMADSSLSVLSYLYLHFFQADFKSENKSRFPIQLGGLEFKKYTFFHFSCCFEITFGMYLSKCFPKYKKFKKSAILICRQLKYHFIYEKKNRQVYFSPSWIEK